MPNGEGALAERVPAAASAVFGERLPVAVRYAELLATEGVRRGLIGPREAPRLWSRHILNCGVLASLLPSDVDVIDVGSGAGLPGIVLSICRPDLSVGLVEPMLRRTQFLTEAIEHLELDNVAVHRGRAEDFAGTLRAARVVARAVAPLPKLLRACWPLVAPNGVLLAMKGESAEKELADARGELRTLGIVGAQIHEIDSGSTEPPVRVIEVPRSGS